MTATYWEIGRRIVQLEQGGEAHAEYGKELLKRLARDLTNRFGRGFSSRNLYLMRNFFQVYPNILQTVSAKLWHSPFLTRQSSRPLTLCFTVRSGGGWLERGSQPGLVEQAAG
jgi:hypothetical protein